MPPRTPVLFSYRLRPSSSGLTPARARRTASEDGGGESLHPLPDRSRVRGSLQGFGWPVGPTEAGLCALALSVATQEPRKAARVRMHPGQDPAIFAKHCSVLI